MRKCEASFRELKRLQAQRLRVRFDADEREEAALQNQIFDGTRRTMQLLKESEADLKRLKNSDSESACDEKIKANILSILAGRLRELTSQFKANEKAHFLKVKEFHGDETAARSEGQLDDQFFAEESQQIQSQYLAARYKDEEISQLVKSINDLASIFKDLSVLAVEQGTILDRIDHNLESAKEDTRGAVEHLEAVREMDKSPRALACIKCQVATIIVLLLVVLIKFTV